jgi:GTP-binding protein
MLPVIALVGRPNVGKSTLFNYLTRSREALVADYPGLTRDRKYGRVKRGQRDCLVVDTGGISDESDGIDSIAKKQVQLALEEADIVFFMVDA